VVDVLRRIHDALVPGGVLVDTQPVARRGRVRVGAEIVGELEGDEWLETVGAVDGEVESAVALGLYEATREERYVVVHAFGSGADASEEVSTWEGVRIPGRLAARLNETKRRVEVEQETRLRLLVRA
jgi:hypothetical protein